MDVTFALVMLRNSNSAAGNGRFVVIAAAASDVKTGVVVVAAAGDVKTGVVVVVIVAELGAVRLRFAIGNVETNGDGVGVLSSSSSSIIYLQLHWFLHFDRV